MKSDVPLIISLKLDKASFAFFDALRQQYFPRERNFLLAHLTLFHHLPGAQIFSIGLKLQEICQKQEKLKLEVTAVKSIGRGVAFEMKSHELLVLHQLLQQEWQDWLIPQDKQKLWPHVTVQNKVPPEEAKKLLQHLSFNFTPFSVTGLGLQLWEYKQGPWELLEEFEFDLRLCFQAYIIIMVGENS